MIKTYSIVMVLTLIIDQIIKLIVRLNMNIYDSIKVIDNFFNITYIHNNGAAWGILAGNRIILIIGSIIVMVIIYLTFVRNAVLTKCQEMIYGILFGGILGNLFDRILYGYVIDYLDFNVFGYNFPVFNFADICIVISMFIITLINFKGSVNDEDNNS